MFSSARFKLTAWYLLIIMIISVLFSVTIYFILTRDLAENYRRFSVRVGQRRYYFTQNQFPNLFDATAVEEAENHLKLNLLYINLVILGLSGALGYILAGRTLRPIQQMVSEQNRFIADASHELRTPLTSLRTSIEVNLRDKKLTLKEAKEVIASNLEEVQNLQTLSDDLLRLARGENKGPNYFSELKLEDIIAQAIKRVILLADSKNIKITTNSLDIQFEGNGDDLISMLVILLDNAIKYSPESSEVVINNSFKDALIHITVSDYGVGIAPSDITHIFDRFYRVDQSRSKTAGYGLGLSIAKKIVEDHCGTIDVKSILGEGTTFTIILPQKQYDHAPTLPLLSKPIAFIKKVLTKKVKSTTINNNFS